MACASCTRLRRRLLQSMEREQELSEKLESSSALKMMPTRYLSAMVVAAHFAAHGAHKPSGIKLARTSSDGSPPSYSRAAMALLATETAALERRADRLIEKLDGLIEPSIDEPLSPSDKWRLGDYENGSV